MKVRINGCKVNLDALSPDELSTLTDSTADRLAQCQRELDMLTSRGGSTVTYMPFAAPPYLKDPA